MFDPLQEVRHRRLLINQVDAWLHEEIAPHLGRRVLEVGSGHGNFVRHLLDRELVVATDVDPSSVEFLSREFAHYPNLCVRVYDICSTADAHLRSLHLDTVVSVNVLEHIEDDLLAISNMADLLCPSGRVVVTVPAHEWLYGTMDSSIGHFRRYTKQTLAWKLAQAGLVVERQFYFNILGALGWLVNGRLFGRMIPPSLQLAWFNRLVPLLRWAEQRIRPPAGVSLVSVAQKWGTG